MGQGPIIVATDGSDEAKRAAAAAAHLFRKGCQVVIATSVDLPDLMDVAGGGFEGPSMRPEEAEAQTKETMVEAEGLIAETAQAFGAAPVEHRVIEGDPGPALVRLAEEIDAEAVVVGAHGKGFFARMFEGSVSRHLVDHAPCPVLVVPAGES